MKPSIQLPTSVLNWSDWQVSRFRARFEALYSGDSNGKRCYLRGLTPLGIFNTVCGCLFDQVLVHVVDTDTGRTVRWYWDAAAKHPPEVAV